MQTDLERLAKKLEEKAQEGIISRWPIPVSYSILAEVVREIIKDKEDELMQEQENKKRLLNPAEDSDLRTHVPNPMRD